MECVSLLSLLFPAPVAQSVAAAVGAVVMWLGDKARAKLAAKVEPKA